MKGLKLFIGSGFGSGYSPVAPGTAGSLLALILIYPVLIFDELIGVLLFMFAASLLTLWVSKTCEEAWGNDPGRLVMDEFAGQSLTFISIAVTGNLTTDLIILALGFILFRIFDILKPFGINQAQKLEGGYGILIDDIIAGFYAFICLKTLIFTFPKFFGAL
jgi:phosphatidylglycerophosphatase A